jgi:hypothetical protein
MAPSLVILQGILAHFGFRRAWYLGAALTPLLQVDDESTLSARPNPDTERGGRVLWLRHEDRATGTDPTTPADLVLIALYYGICGERRNWGRALERGMGVLTKPFAMDGLANKLHEIKSAK